MSSREIFDLKKELEFRRRQIVKLEHELRERDEKVINLEHFARQCEEENRQARDTLLHLDEKLEQRALKASEVQKGKFRQLVDDLSTENKHMKKQIAKLEIDSNLLKQRESEIEFLNNKLKEVAESHGNREALKDLRGQRDDNLRLKKELELKSRDLTVLSNQMQAVLSQNRVLREMAGVPENYGFNLQEIKVAEHQKIQQYKARVDYLQQEVEALERERVELKYKLRNLSTLYGQKGLRFHHLTAEQMKLVDEFAQNLRQGRIDLPLNDRSRELLKQIQKLKAQLQILESHAFGIPSKDGFNDQLLQQIRQQNREVKELLLKLYSGTGTTAKQKETLQRHVLQIPPVPIPDGTGDFPDGYSYRFSSKLPVPEIWTGDPKRDLSALQLQVVQLVQLLNRRDEDEKITAFQLEDFRGKLREILLVIEELYKEYSTTKETFQTQAKQLNQEYESILQELRETRAQLAVHEDLNKTLQSNSQSVQRRKLAEQASKIALLEVNALRLSRKYDCLQSEEKDLRQAYHSIEAEHAQKDVMVLKRIGKLKEWRVSASSQLQFLFRQLRQSVPLEHFQEVCAQLEILREKQADWILREAELYKRIAKFENMEHQNLELHQKVRSQQTFKIQLQAELEMISKRLEIHDSSFKLEQAVISRIVSHLKSNFISPEKAFAIFDKNKDGKISRQEFKAGLENIGIKLKPAQLEGIIRGIDIDGDGSIKYQEFCRKLQIYGVSKISEEQQILQLIFNSAAKLSYTLYDVFQIFDSDGSGEISKQEMVDGLNNFNIGLSRGQIQKVVRMIDVNKDDKIEFSQFSKVFQRELEIVKPEQKGGDWKDQLFKRISEAIKAHNLDLMQAFSEFDQNHDGRISKSEFIAAFNRMAAGLSRQQLEELWNSMNQDRDGYISYAQFVAQFRSSQANQREAQIVQQAKSAYMHLPQHGRDNKRQLAVMEARQQAALNKAQRYQVRMRNIESSLAQTESQLIQQENKLLQMTKLYHLLQEENVQQKAKLANTVSKSQAERLLQGNHLLQQELAEARAAMNTYKSLISVSSDHVRALKLTIEKKKDELDTFQSAVRELQAESHQAAIVGKLYHQIMVSRWAEATVNRKYDNNLNQTRQLRSDTFRLESELMDTQKSLYDVQQVLTEKISSYEGRIKELKSRADHNISLDKANELVAQIRNIGDRKSELEDLNRKLRSQISEYQANVEQARVMKQTADQIYHLIKTGSSDEISDKLVEMAQKVSELRLSELKAKREMNLSKEKEEYLSRLHMQDLDSIKALQQQTAKWEAIMAKKEQAWRKKDDQRQKMLLNPKFHPVLPSKKSPKDISKPTHKQKKEKSKKKQKKKDKMKILKQQLKRAEQNIQMQHQQIANLTQIRQYHQQVQTNSQFTSADLARIRGQYQTDALASAANNTIATLQDMLEHKTNQLKRADQLNQKLKQDLLKTQQEASLQIQQLAYELKDARDTSQVQFFNAMQQVASRPRTTTYKPQNDTLIQQKDERIQQLTSQVNQAIRARQQAENRLNALRKELEQTQYELNLEKSKNTGEAHRRELEAVRKQFQMKEAELQALKTSLGRLKADLLTAAQTNQKKQRQLQRVAVIEGQEDNTLMIQNMKKAQQRINILRKQVKDLRQENESIKKQRIESREIETKIRQENKAMKEIQHKKQDQLDKTIRENRALKERLQQSKKKPEPVRQPTPSRQNEIKSLKNTLTKLEQQNKRLNQQISMTKQISPYESSLLKRLGSVLKSRRLNLTQVLENKKNLQPAELQRYLNTKNLGLDQDEISTLVQIASIHAFINDSVSVRKFEGLLRRTQSRPMSRTQRFQQSKPQEDPRLAMRMELLKKQLTQKGKELEIKQRQLAHWEGLAKKLQEENQAFVNRVQPTQANLTPSAPIESVEELRYTIYQYQQKVQALQKQIKFSLSSELKNMKDQYKVLYQDHKKLSVQNLRLNSELKQVRTSRIRSVQGITQDEFYQRDIRIQQLQEEIQQFTNRESELRNRIGQYKRENLELKFDKEQSQLQFSRLQRRIRELEQYKETASGKPKQEIKTLKFSQIEDIRFSSESSLHVAPREQEALIASLKKAVEKLKLENESLKKLEQGQDKLLEKTKTEKLLRNQIRGLENELFELKSREDINRDLESKLKIVNEANEKLRKNLERDQVLVEEAEHKYRGLLLHHESLQQDNERLRNALDELTL